jgi:hypothetical protein
MRLSANTGAFTGAFDLPDGDACGYIKVIMQATYFYFGYFWGFPAAGGMSRRVR